MVCYDEDRRQRPMGTDLVYSWYNVCIGEEYFEVRDAEVGDPDTLRGTCHAESLKFAPHPRNIAPRGAREMNEIQVQVVQPELRVGEPL